MNEEVINLIKKYIDTTQELREYCDILDKTMGLEIEGKLRTHLYSLEDTCKDAIKLLTDQDTLGWVEWFIWDNECGEKAFEAGYHSDLKKITDFDVFVDHILKHEK